MCKSRDGIKKTPHTIHWQKNPSVDPFVISLFWEDYVVQNR